MAKKKKTQKTKKTTTRKKVAQNKALSKKAKSASKRTAKKVTKKTAKKTSFKKAATKALHNIEVEAQKIVSKIKDIAHNIVDHKHPMIGRDAPTLTLKNQKEEDVDLAALVTNNKKVVLYFYPKDDTPGCTKEACDFRDSMNRVAATGAVILGASPDKPASHQKFIEKYSLNFGLLSDPDHRLGEGFGVWKEKAFMGRKYMGIERSTFLFIDGKIARVWQPVKVEGHVDEVLAALNG